MLNTSSIKAHTWPKELSQRYIDRGYWQGKTLFDAFREACSRFAERPAILAPVRLSYRALEQRVLALAEVLQKRGLQQGDTLVLQLPNSPAFIEYLFAAFAIGAIPVMALPAHRSRELNHFLKASSAKAFIAMKQPAGGIGGFKSLKNIAWQGEIIAVQPQGAESLNFFEGDIKNTVSAKDVALMQLSGGTTGLPKLIARTHDDYLYSILASNEICQVTKDSVYLCVLPAAHNFTLSSPGLLGTLLAGGAVALFEQLDAQKAFRIIANYRVSHCALVPPLALNWLNYFRLNPTEKPPLGELTSLLVGGAKLNPTSAEALMDVLGAPLQQVFGMAEGLVNYTRLTDSRNKRCYTQGRPISDDDEILVVDDEDKPVAIGEAGHLLTRGPYTIRGYFNAPEHNRKAFTHEGFYRTGDIVKVDAEGYITVEGRNKDQINRGGEKISAAELEDYLLKNEAISDAAVVAINDEYLGERTAACIVTTSNQRITLADCRRFLKQFDIADFKLPDKVYCLNQLPKTPFGKVSKKHLRDQLQNNQ